MPEVIESTTLLFHVLLTLVGVFIVIVILRVCKFYRIMKINRSVMTPMLFAGFFTALSGITELMEPYMNKVAETAHAIAMLLTAIFFAYGIYAYQQMLKRATKLQDS